MSGTGNYNFDVQVAKNLTGSNRSIIFRVLFCGTEYEDFTLTQGTTQEKKITEIIYTNNTLTQWQRS